VTLASNVVSTSYTATGLTFGQTYNFKVEARNGFGYSIPSSPKAILCASAPEKPATPSTSVSGSTITFTWAAPVANGTPIIAYKVYIR
jgi:hypothetical protein